MQNVRRVESASAFDRIASSFMPINRPAATPARRWGALAIAVAADAVQIALAPFTVEGVLSPVNDAIDVAVALTLTRLLGWHMAFLPSFAMKMVPFVDLAPSWTIAALVALRSSGNAKASAPRGDLIDSPSPANSV